MHDMFRVLVVDDEEQFLKTITKLLERKGFAITAVRTGAQAVEAARKEEFYVALVDLKMPGMDGEEVLEVLKKEHEFMETIVLTGHGSIDSAIRSTELDVFSYLQKPVELDTLLHVINGAYAKSAQKRKRAET